MNPATVRAAAARLPDCGDRSPFEVYRIAVKETPINWSEPEMLTAAHRDTGEIRTWDGKAWSGPAAAPPDPDAALRSWWANVVRLFDRFTDHEYEHPPLDQAARDQHATGRSAWTYARELSGTDPNPETEGTAHAEDDHAST